MNETFESPIREAQCSRILFWLTALIVGVAFFVTEHELRVSSAEAFASTLDEMEVAATGGNTLRRLAFLALGCLGLWYLLRTSRQPFRPWSLPGGMILFYVFWCVASTLWSDDPGMTARRCGVLVCFVLAAMGIGKQFAPRNLLQLAVLLPSLYLAVGFGTELALGTFRPFGADYRFSGTLHPNTQGMCLAAMCLACWCLSRSETGKKWFYLLLFGVGFFFLLLTKSRTSCGGMLLSMAAIWLLTTSLRSKLLIGLGGGWMVCLALVVTLLSNVDLAENLTGAALMGRREQASSLTGRVPIWTELNPYFEDRSLVGYGYDSFWTADRIETISSEMQWGIREAHCGYLDTLLSVGLIGGLVLLLIVMGAMYQAAGRYIATRDSSYGFLFGLLLFAMVNAVTESGMLMPLFAPFLITCGLSMLAIQRLPATNSVLRKERSPIDLSDVVNQLRLRELRGRL